MGAGGVVVEGKTREAMEGTEGKVPVLAAQCGGESVPTSFGAVGTDPTSSGSVISMKTHSILRGRVHRLHSAARWAAIALLGLTAGGCGIAEMFDPTPPLYPSRTQSRYRAPGDPIAAHRLYQPPSLAGSPNGAPPVEDDPFGPARPSWTKPLEMKPPEAALASQDVNEVERPRRPVVVIGKPSPTPSVAGAPGVAQTPPSAPVASTPPNTTPGNSTPPALAESPASPAETERPQAVAKADPGEMSPSLVARPPEVQTAQTEPRVRMNPPAPATKPVRIASTGSGESRHTEVARPVEPAHPPEAIPAAPPEANIQPRTLTQEQIKLRARVAELKEQLKKGNEVDERDDRGRTLLQQAAIAGELEVAETLLDSGANIKAQDSQGWTALHWAASSGHPEICELLIASGASIDARGWLGDTPLYWAATFDRHDVAELLLARGADVNATDKQGRSALHAAIEADAIATVKVLLAHQADLAARDAAGLTPLHQAVFQCRKSMAEAATGDAGVDSPEAAQASARIAPGDRQQARQKALDRGCNMVRLLVSKGAQVNAASDRGVTPLHLAAWDEMADVAEILLAAGADPAAKDLHDRTPVEYAKQRHQKSAMRLLTASARGQ